MSIRFHADNDLRKAILRGAVRAATEMDFRSAQAARLAGLSDSEVLARAADDDRILVSHDFHTMPDHFREFVKKRRSPGVLLIRQDLRIGIAVESILTVWAVSEPGDWVNRLLHHPQPRDRCRRCGRKGN